MYLKKIPIKITFLFVMILLVITFANKGNDAYAKTSDFQIKNNVLIKYNGTAENVIIPDGVVSIKDGAFYGNKKIKTISMPNSVISIESPQPSNFFNYFPGAFEDCTSLSSISLSNKLTDIGDFAFYNCSSLKSINLPNKLEAIGEYAFSWCKKLESITIPDNITEISNYAFMNCLSLQEINLNKVSIIDEGAFYKCSSLKKITFPSELGEIGTSAFSKCSSLKTITITKNIYRIDSGAFSYCSSIQNFNVDGENIFFSAIDGVLYNISKTVLYAYPARSPKTDFSVSEGTKIIADYAFSGSANLVSIKIPNSITGIYPFTFSESKKVEDIVLPETVQVIGEGAFENCKSLKSIRIPDSVIRLGEFHGKGVFYGCGGLTSITIPSSVKIVYEGTLQACDNIRSITLKEGVKIFYGNNMSKKFEKINLPKSLIKLDGNQLIGTKWYSQKKAGWVYLDKHLIDYKEDKTHLASKITSYTVKDGTVSINDEAFNHMDRLMKLTVPKSVIYYNYNEDYIGKYDYGKNGSNLENTYWYLNQPNGVVYVGSVAFRLKNEGKGFTVGLNYGTKEEIEIANKKDKLRRKYKLVTFDSISFKEGTVSITNNFAKETNLNSSKLKFVFPSSLRLIGVEALNNNYSGIHKITWNAKLNYIETEAISDGNVDEYKLYKNFPSNTEVLGDDFLYVALNEIDNDCAQILWMRDNIISKYLDYDADSKTLTIKSYIPYLDKIENKYLTFTRGVGNYYDKFYDNVIVPDDMVCIADYLFGYGNWSNPNLKLN